MGTIKIERLDGKPLTNEFERSGYFVAVFKNGVCEGTCLTDGTLTPQECLESVYNNREIDRLEGLEEERIDSNSNY